MSMCSDYGCWLTIAIGVVFVLLIYIVRLKRQMHERKNDEMLLLHENYFDPITKLPNRENVEYIFEAQIDRSLRHNQSFYILALQLKNLDEIKALSKDLLISFLKEASDIMVKATRDEDLAAHVQEDVFVILFNEYLDGDKYKIVVERLEKDFAESKFKYQDLEYGYEIGIGTSQYPVDGKNGAELIEAAIKNIK